MLNPMLEMPHGKQDALGFAAAPTPILTKATCKGGFLLGWLELCQEQGVSNPDFLCIERLDHCWNKLCQSCASGNVGGSLANLRPNLLDGVLRFLQIQKRMESLRLFQWVNISTLYIFNLSLVHLKLSMTSTTMEFCMPWNCYL